MYDVNVVTLIGNLTRDPELSQTKSGKSMCKFALANNPGNEKEEVSFFNIIAWGTTAEVCSKYLKKGSKVVLSGKLRQNRWTSKEGQARSTVEITADNVNFIKTGRQDTPQDTPQDMPETKRAPGGHNPGGEDIPF